MMRGTSCILAGVAASRDFFQVQPGFLSSPVTIESFGYGTYMSPLPGAELQAASFGSSADLAPAAPALPSDDYVGTACIVAMFAIFGYSLRTMTARQPPASSAPVADGAALRLAGALPVAMLGVGGKSTALVNIALDKTTVIKAKLLSECAGGLGEPVDPALVSELVLQLEAQNKTKAPATSALLNGEWKFLYASGASPALQALQLMLKGAQAIPRAPFGPEPVAIGDTYLTISGQRSATAATKVRMMGALETTLKLKSKLVADSPVRLVETYESAGSEPVGLFPLQLPALPYKRPVLVSYLDETMLIVRDAAGRPDVLTRVSGHVDTDEVAPINEAAEKIGEAVTGFETQVKEIADDVIEAAVEAAHKAERDAYFDAEELKKFVGEERAAFCELRAEALAERAALAKKLHEELTTRIEDFEERQLPFAEAEARAFCEEKLAELEDAADKLADHIASVAGSALQREIDALTERQAFFRDAAEEMQALVASFDESATAAEQAEARRFLREGPVYYAQQAEALSARVAFFQTEADACDEERAAFFEQTDAQEEAEPKKKRGLFGFLRRNKAKAVNVEKGAKAKALKVEKAVQNWNKKRDQEQERKEEALQLNKAVLQKLREEKKEARDVSKAAAKAAAQADAAVEQAFHDVAATAAEGVSSGLDQWREGVLEEERAVGEAAAKKVDEMTKSVEGAVDAEEQRVEKALKKKRGIFGFLRRNKDGKTKKAKRFAKKGRVQAKSRAAKKGWFGFLRRKKAVEGNGDNTA
jgi:hypothetical protein